LKTKKQQNFQLKKKIHHQTMNSSIINLKDNKKKKKLKRKFNLKKKRKDNQTIA
jgi:hypothetical protein